MNAALLRTLLAGSFGNRWRAALAVVCIALGVALAGAVHTIHSSALDEIGRAARTLSGTADFEVRGPRNGFDDAHFTPIARIPGVLVASPVLEVEATLAERSETVRVLGIDAFRAVRLQAGFIAPSSGASVEASASRIDAESAYLTPLALANLGLKVGDAFALRAGSSVARFQVAGALPALDAGGAVAVMDIAAAQRAFGRVGTLSRIDIRLAPGADSTAVRRALAAILPPGVAVIAPDTVSRLSASLTRAYRVNLTALALVALATGAFLVFATMALQAARRRSEFALLRALGLERRGVAIFAAAEGAILGLAGALLGTVLGLAGADLMLRRVGYDLGAGFFASSGHAIAPDPVALAAIALLGIATAVGAALAVANSLARLEVAEGLRDRTADLPVAGIGVAIPLALLVIAALLALAPAVAGLPVAGYAAIALGLGAAVLLVAPLMRMLLGNAPRTDHPVAFLAIAQVRSLPGHLTATVAGIVVSVALAASMGVMVHSFRLSLDAWLAGVLGADLYVRSSPMGDSGYFPAADVARIAALPEVATVEALRYDRLLLGDPPSPVTVIARPLSTRTLAGFQAEPAQGPPAAGPIGVWVSTAATDLHGWKAGSDISLPIAGRDTKLHVVGTFRDYARTWGAVLMDQADYRRATNDDRANDLALRLREGVDATRASDAIRRILPDARLAFDDPGEIHRRSLLLFDRTFAVTWALEAVAALIALAGLTSSFAALAWSRRREFGVLRHLGLARRDVLRLLALEGATTGALGALIGLAAGAAVSAVLVHVVNRQSFHWDIELHWPWAALALLFAATVALCALGATLAGRAAVSREAVFAVKDDA
jgi:putative ABC transport system permease protein